MATHKAFMDICYQVGEVGEHPLTVSPDPDAPGDFVRLHTANDAAKEYWGKIDFTMPKEVARALGEALIAASSTKEQA